MKEVEAPDISQKQWQK